MNSWIYEFLNMLIYEFLNMLMYEFLNMLICSPKRVLYVCDKSTITTAELELETTGLVLELKTISPQTTHWLTILFSSHVGLLWRASDILLKQGKPSRHQSDVGVGFPVSFGLGFCHACETQQTFVGVVPLENVTVQASWRINSYPATLQNCLHCWE